MTSEQPWWRNTVFYQIYPRSFADGNGDGIGDLIGVRERLDYLVELGVEALWLSPFFRSPMADGGYDVADPCDVDPMFGTLADFDALVAAAHERRLRVTVDIVPNHFSDQHVWFQAALGAGPGSPERERFIFREGRGESPPNNWPSVFGGPAWSRVPDGQWYLHLFAPEQPDLNWANPEVPAEFERILRFWLDRGVDGFRVDVAHGMAKPAGLPDVDLSKLPARHEGPMPSLTDLRWDRDGVHDHLRMFRRVLDSYPGDRMAVGEAWVPDDERLARYVRPDELNLAFNFRLVQARWGADTFQDAINSSLSAMARVGAPCTWVLSNHDVVRHVTRYGGGALGLARGRAAALVQL
ncbi:MAG TPA: alpha-amylase family glycosyl hydrolase, partial [Jatrophihabitantaceae bacterium]